MVGMGIDFYLDFALPTGEDDLIVEGQGAASARSHIIDFKRCTPFVFQEKNM